MTKLGRVQRKALKKRAVVSKTITSANLKSRVRPMGDADFIYWVATWAGGNAGNSIRETFLDMISAVDPGQLAKKTL